MSLLEKYLPVFAPDAPTTPSGGSDSGGSSSSTPSDSSSSGTPSTSSSALPPAGGETQTPDVSAGVDSSAFEFMFGSDETTDPLGPGLAPSVEAVPAVVPATTPPATTATPLVPGQPQVPQTTEPAPPAQPGTTSPAPSVPSLDLFDPGQLAQHLITNNEQVVQYVADNLFKLSDKDVEALESDVVGTIPKLLARSFVAAQQNLLMQMQRIIPTMIQRQGEVTKRHSEAEGEFYTRWPDIKKDQHGNTVMQYAAVYRQMHPEASRKDMIEAIGPMVMMASKIVPQTPGTQPVVPRVASPMVPMQGRPPQPAPFVPAGPSAGGAMIQNTPQLSDVESMFVSDQ